MEKIKITCDSTCDLSPELVEKYDIEVLPLSITLGDRIFADGVDVHAEDVFAYAKESGSLPKTAAVSIGQYEDAFRRWTEQGYRVIHINLSSELSSCYQNACLAASEVGNVFPIDSRNLSTASGLLAIAARELADEGKSAEEIADAINACKGRLDASFILQTLDYLKMGGRCSGVAALGANLLKLRPEIIVDDGTMRVGRKYRGAKAQTVKDYVRGRLEGRTDIDCRRIVMTDSHLDPEILAEARALILELQPFEELLEVKAGCTISSHCGPECFGVLFFTK